MAKTTIDQLASAALAGNALQARELAHNFLAAYPDLGLVPSPATKSGDVLVVSAALVEMLAQRRAQQAPSWTSVVGSSPAPRYLLFAARTMRRLRAQCEAESPEPLRRRQIYAPADYLSFA